MPRIKIQSVKDSEKQAGVMLIQEDGKHEDKWAADGERERERDAERTKANGDRAIWARTDEEAEGDDEKGTCRERESHREKYTRSKM